MKRLLQLIGIRKWSGEDLISLQAEPLKTIDAFFATYGNSIFNGCEVSETAPDAYNITPGFVALQGKDQDNRDTFKVAPFPGLENTALPVYLTLAYNVIEKEYIDGKVKPAAYDYYAAASSIRPEDETPYLEITAAGGRRFTDAIGITRKLDKTGNGKDVTVTFAQAAARTNIQTGDKLTAITGKIARWLADLKMVAFSGKMADLADDTAHRFVADTEKAGWNDKYTRAETDTRDTAALAAAKNYTDTLGGNVYKKTETYTKTETDNKITVLGNDVYRKAETYTRTETDTRDAGTLAAARQYATDRIAEIIGGSPAALDTLYEIAAALGNDPNFVTTIMALINGKAPLAHTHTPEQCGAAAADHSHTGYATATHNHDATYAQSNHSHNADQISDTATKVIMTAAERSKLAATEPFVINSKIVNLKTTSDAAKIQEAFGGDEGFDEFVKGTKTFRPVLINLKNLNNTMGINGMLTVDYCCIEPEGFNAKEIGITFSMTSTIYFKVIRCSLVDGKNIPEYLNASNSTLSFDAY